MRKLVVTCAAVVALLAVVSPAAAADQDEAAAWRPVGLMRIRDLTPFGITRLDMLPAHAVAATPGTWAVETNLSWQNTYVLSENVKQYLEGRADPGPGRAPLSDGDVRAILALPEDAYYVDGELGLADLTMHYRFSTYVGLYATIPFFYFDGGFLDGTIESFHEEAGFSTAGRDLVARNRFQVVAGIGDAALVLDEAPSGGELGDPVFGLRYSVVPVPDRWNLVVEGAAKLALRDEQRLVTSGANDYGVQATYQRFFRRQALYFSAAAVYVESPRAQAPFQEDDVIPTLLAGWELRLSRRTNGIVQLYASPSVVQGSTAEELTEDKYQVTLGLQTLQDDGTVLRFGITENLSNFNNTPDVGVTVSIAKVFLRAR